MGYPGQKRLQPKRGPGGCSAGVPLPNWPCDYLLFVNDKAAGGIETKKSGTTLSGVSDQSDKYMQALSEYLATWSNTLCFGYESNGEETYSRHSTDPKPRSLPIFAFHRPETIRRWVDQAEPKK